MNELTLFVSTEQLDPFVKPFWLDEQMLDESVLFVQEEAGTPPDAPLLFFPRHIESVASATLQRRYVEGRDWVFSNGRLRLPSGSAIPFLTRQQLRPASAPDGAGLMSAKDGKNGVLFAEGAYFHSLQSVVTYRHRSQDWQGPRPGFRQEGPRRPKHLPRTLTRLHHREPVHLALYGDSIAAGSNSSALIGAPPFLPVWGNLMHGKLARHYQGTIVFTNASEGGWETGWALAQVEQRVACKRPDLAILAFGMNDGTGGLAGEKFAGNIAAMMQIIRLQQPEAEFILDAPMLANPESTFDVRQPEYGEALRRLAKTDAGAPVVVDMGAMHAEMLKAKRYVDLTGNNINHPNDFLARVHAMSILAELIVF